MRPLITPLSSLDNVMKMRLLIVSSLNHPQLGLLPSPLINEYAMSLRSVWVISNALGLWKVKL